MKRICLILLLFVPLISSAQRHLLGKSPEEVRTDQKEANCPFERTTITKLFMCDRFCYNNDFERLCYYRKDTCYKVTEVLDFSILDTARQRLNASAQKVKKNQWIDKYAGVKIKLSRFKDMFFLDYTALDKHRD
jgi:hypothetical protein